MIINVPIETYRRLLESEKALAAAYHLYEKYDVEGRKKQAIRAAGEPVKGQGKEEV
jgi:hypothetical protein